MEYMQYGAMAFGVVTAIVHVLLALGIWTNASLRERDQKPLMYVGAGTWALAALVSGALGVLVYWLIHHSALRKLYGKDGKTESHD